MQAGGEEHEQSKLLPHFEPPVQPAGESGVLCSPDQLDVRRNDAGSVAGGQEGQSVQGEGLVQGVHRNVVPPVPVPGSVTPD